MKSRTTAFLALLVLVIGGVAYWDYKKNPTTDELRDRLKKLIAFKAADVTKLELIRSNQTVIVERSGERWEIKQPLAVHANAATINSILDSLEFADRKRTLAAKELAGVNRTEFGLDQPKFRVVLHTKKSPIKLAFGNATPSKDALYVQVEGQKDVALTRPTLLDQIDRGLDDLRDRTVLDFTPTAATRLEIKSAQRAIELAKSAATTNAEPRWAISRPLATRADQQKVNSLLNDLNGLRVLDFVSEDPKEMHTYHLDEPLHEINVFTGDSSKTLLIGPALTNDATKVYAKVRAADSIFTVAADVTKKFAAQVNDVRDSRVLTFEPPDLKGIELVRGTDKTTLAITNNIWKLTAPAALAGSETEEAVVGKLLTELGNLTIKQFTADVAADLDKYGLAAPTVTVSLLGGGTNVLAQLLVGALGETNTLRYVKRADEPFIYGVDTNIVAWLPASALALRSRRLAELKPQQITKFIVQKAGAKFVTERAADGKWRLVEPSQGALNNDALQSMLIAISQLHAREFVRVGLDSLAEYGLNAPELTATAYVGDKPYTLSIGKPNGAEDKFVSWNDPAFVISVSSADLNLFARDLVVAPLPPTPPSPPAK